MKVEQRTVYITSDGKEFTDEAEARAHERTAVLHTYLNRHGCPVYWRDPDINDIVNDILDAFVVIPKEAAHEMFLTLDEAASFVAGFEDEPGQEGVKGLLEEVQAAMERLRPTT